MKSYTGWHFAAPTLRDGTPLPRKGDKLTLDGEPEMCKRGYHASKRAIDALKYAPGNMVCRVRLSGTVLTQGDKACATVRTNLTDYADATRTMHEFAVWCARCALEQAGNPDPRSVAALDCKERWIRGKATDKELAAARDAARDAAWDAARAAALDSAWDAARAAAWDAARAAALDSAWDAARAAAWDAQNVELERRLKELLK